MSALQCIVVVLSLLVPLQCLARIRGKKNAWPNLTVIVTKADFGRHHA